MLKHLLRGTAILAVGVVVVAPAPPVAARAQQTAQQQQTQQPVFRSAVDLVRVDVQVVTERGEPVIGLGLDDFQAWLDGKARKVASAELVTFEQPPVGGAIDPIHTPGRVPDDARVFVIAIDQMGLSAAAIAPMKESVRKFLRQLRPQDMVGLYEFPFRSRDFEISHDRLIVSRGLDRVLGMRDSNESSFNLTPSEVIDISANDADALNRAFERECNTTVVMLAAEDLQGCRDMLRIEARGLAGAWENQASQRMNELVKLAQSLQFIQGRKTIVLVSNGLAASNRPGGRPDVTMMMQMVGDDVANAQANLYVLHLDTTFMDAYSASARTSLRSADRFQSANADRQVVTSGLDILAGRSGGRLFSVEAGTPDFVFDRVLRETTAYYVIGVEPTDDDRDGKPHYIRVKTTADKATVRARVQVAIPKK